MYIIQNAWKSIVRNKGRNILIGIIALIIALSSCLALSIRQAAETVRTQTLSQTNITAQISFDRSGAMQEIADQMGQPPEQGEAPDTEGGSRRENFDFDALSGETLTLEDYMTYTQALSQGDGYYYTLSMAAQVVTPIAAGALISAVGYRVLFPYAACFAALAFVTMCFVRHGDVKAAGKRGLDAFGDMD